MSEQECNSEDSNQELFQIIDETGEGWGFDLTPETMVRPMLIATGSLFGMGMLAGIPAGLAVGRAQLGSDSPAAQKQVKPTLGGFLFATRAFLYGTMLCGAFGVAGMYGLKWYFQADSFEEFGTAMRNVVPKRREEMEKGLDPVISRIRARASASLPEPVRRLQERFRRSSTGVWIRSRLGLESDSDRPTDSANHERQLQEVSTGSEGR